MIVETETDVAIRVARILVAVSDGERDTVLVLARALVDQTDQLKSAVPTLDDEDRAALLALWNACGDRSVASRVGSVLVRLGVLEGDDD